MSGRFVHVVGARPNFMKIAPVMRALSAEPGEFEQLLIHTGQHYDSGLSDRVMVDLDLPQPDLNLAVGSGSHSKQTAEVMIGLERALEGLEPDWVVVVGDVNSTLAAALVAAKMGIPVAHVEAGLRSFDTTMPEEINRVLTDRLAGLLFTPSRDADENLLAEGVPADRIQLVGNVMIDSLQRVLPFARERWPSLRFSLKLGDRPFIAATLHRPVNVDHPENFEILVSSMRELGRRFPIVFPVHPRTRSRCAALLEADEGLRIIEPLGYLDFLSLEAHATAVLTDSGGIQEETTYLGIPCLTVRTTTERPVTISQGTNRLVALDRGEIVSAALDALERGPRRRTPPELWDGRTAQRIAAIFREQLNAPAADGNREWPSDQSLPDSANEALNLGRSSSLGR